MRLATGPGVRLFAYLAACLFAAQWAALAGCDAPLDGAFAQRGGTTSRGGPTLVNGPGGAPSTSGMGMVDGGTIPSGPGDVRIPTGNSAQDAGTGAAASPYPSGPYGTRQSQILDDLAFTDSAGARRTLSQIRADTSVKVILWISSTEWCPTCRDQVPTLNQIQSSYRTRGVYVVTSLHEDRSYSPAAPDTAQRWVSELGAQYEVVAEPSPPHDNHQINPTSWVIDAETMRVLNYIEGEQPGLEQTLDTALAAARR